MEEAITGDYALIKGWKADSHGNMVFRMASRNFNVPMAKAAKITIAEVRSFDDLTASCVLLGSILTACWPCKSSVQIYC